MNTDFPVLRHVMISQWQWISRGGTNLCLIIAFIANMIIGGIAHGT